jgi:hypothetical protein
MINSIVTCVYSDKSLIRSVIRSLYQIFYMRDEVEKWRITAPHFFAHYTKKRVVSPDRYLCIISIRLNQRFNQNCKKYRFLYVYEIIEQKFGLSLEDHRFFIDW